uniref:SUN domain-containing protein n=1 Tax=Periophthalmus magnuspinnatus TaxID=409849 RepID=A0A3B3ZBJ9_9GOBI
MDFSQLHTYTPPLCAPDNTGYTYALSSSYSTTALEFEKEHKIAPVYESPRMSRRSLRLKNSTAAQLDNSNVVDYYSQSSSSYSSSTRKETRANSSKSHTTVANGYLCKDCAHHSSQRAGVLTTQTTSSSSSSSSSCVQEASTDVLSSLLQVRGYVQIFFFLIVTYRFVTLIIFLTVNTGKGLLWFLACGWYHLVSLMSLLNMSGLKLSLIPAHTIFMKNMAQSHSLFFHVALWWWGPSIAVLFAYLPAINLTEWRPASPITVLSNLMPTQKSVSVSAPVSAPESSVEYTPTTPVSQASKQLALLWERVKQGDERQEQRHGDILVLYNNLKEQLHTETDREKLVLWVSSLLEQRLGALHGELEKDRAQTAEQQKQQQESQGARLAELELLLKALAARTEVFHKNILTVMIVGVQQEDHAALLAQVKRLESELGRIRDDLQGVIGCKGKCEQLDTLQETVMSAQVRKELQALFYGSGNEGEVPESLLLWLSQHYTRTQDLRAALAELELNILRNVSLQLELNKAQTMGEVQSHTQNIVKTVTGTVQRTASAEGLTEEHVKVIVQNALKLFSQDRTGLVDFALESGGGSILSTRCSETYETKTALMSLFGLPLWYFSQSPRVVIQPDVYPGNCWAFKGSQGYLVIRLSMRVVPTSFCVEHIPKTLSPTGNITSAPRNFTVFGLDDEYQEEGKLLGNYIYQEDGDSLQTFPVMEPNEKAFQIIEVRVLSNWGHPEYTCLYRIRVHGEPQPQ